MKYADKLELLHLEILIRLVEEKMHKVKEEEDKALLRGIKEELRDLHDARNRKLQERLDKILNRDR